MLSLLVFSPIILGISLFFIPKKYLKSAALGGGFLCFLLSLKLFYFFEPSTAQLQMVQKIPLIPFFGNELFSWSGWTLFLVCSSDHFFTAFNCALLLETESASLFLFIISSLQHCFRNFFKL